MKFIIAGLIVLVVLLVVVIISKKLCPDLIKINLKTFGSAGPQLNLEFKDQINKVAKATEDESKEQPEPTELQSIPFEQQRLEKLEEKVKNLQKALLGTSTVAVNTGKDYLDQERMEFFKQIQAQTYKDVCESDPHSDLVEFVFPLLRECSTCYSYSSGWGTCQKDNSKREPNDVCDDWTSHPKS